MAIDNVNMLLGSAVHENFCYFFIIYDLKPVCTRRQNKCFNNFWGNDIAQEIHQKICCF